MPPTVMVTPLAAGLHAWDAREMLAGSNQASVFAVGIVFSVLAISVMALRIYCRLSIINCGLGTDDCAWRYPFPLFSLQRICTDMTPLS